MEETMKARMRMVALVMVGLMASGCTDRDDAVPRVGDRIDGQIVFQVNDDGSFFTAPDVPCIHEDGSDQELPCVWRADRQGNLRGDSVIVMPGNDGEQEFIPFDQ
jgi:hypothetical protein